MTVADVSQRGLTEPENLAHRLQRRYREAQPFLETSKGRVAVLSVASIAAGVLEAATLLSIAQLALAISTGERSVTVPAGPLGDFELTIAQMILVSAAFTTARLALQLLIAYLPAQMGADAQAKLRRRVFDAFLRTTWDVQAREREGHLQEVMVGQVNRATAAIQVLADAVTSAFNFLALMVSAFFLSPLSAGAIAFTVLVLFFLLRPLTTRARAMSARRSRAYVHISEVIGDAVRMAEEVHVFGVADVQQSIVSREIERLRRPLFWAQLLSRVQTGIYQGVALLLVVAGLAAVYNLGRSDIGSLGAVVLIMVRGLTYSQNLQSAYHRMNDLLPDMGLVHQTLERYRGNERSSGSAPVPQRMDIAFDQVSFEYRPDVPVLTSVSFGIRHGSAVGIIGPSGAGKSTVVQLLLRLREPTRGRVTVNGESAEHFSLQEWHARMSYVPQDGRLIHGTVAENIAFHREVTPDRIVEAATLAGIHDEIVGWPRGYDTRVGQRTDAVSGGQRQRITIARALVQQPSVLILDEPTSALDLDSEAVIQETLERLKGTVTIVIIAHRLSTLSSCDQLMVFEAGALTASGPADALLSSNDFYRRAVAQSRLA